MLYSGSEIFCTRGVLPSSGEIFCHSKTVDKSGVMSVLGGPIIVQSTIVSSPRFAPRKSGDTSSVYSEVQGTLAKRKAGLF